MSKIEQLINEISNLTILESAELVKELETKFGISAASMAVGQAGAAPAEAPKAAEEKSEYKVELIEADQSKKIEIIKALRKVKAGLGLTEAKAAVENPPFVVADAASKADATMMKETLEAAGAKVKLS